MQRNLNSTPSVCWWGGKTKPIQIGLYSLDSFILSWLKNVTGIRKLLADSVLGFDFTLYFTWGNWKLSFFNGTCSFVYVFFVFWFRGFCLSLMSSEGSVVEGFRLLSEWENKRVSRCSFPSEQQDELTCSVAAESLLGGEKVRISNCAVVIQYGHTISVTAHDQTELDKM